MAIKRRKFQLGVRLKPTTQPTVDNGDMSVNSDDNKLKITTYDYSEYENATSYEVGYKVKYSPENKNYICIQNSTGNLPTNTSFWEVYEQSVVTEDQDQILTNKTIDGSSTGTNDVTIDATSANYDDTVETVKSLLKTDGINPVENVQEALDAVKRELDGQNEASEIEFNPTADVPSDNVQGAIEDVQSNLQGHLDSTTAHDASEIVYDNTISGLLASDTQSAIDEVESRLDTAETDLNTAESKVDDLITLSGYPANTTDLGTFTGGVISDNTDLQNALQELATEASTNTGNLLTHTSGTEEHGAEGEVVGTLNQGQILKSKIYEEAYFSKMTLEGIDNNDQAGADIVLTEPTQPIIRLVGDLFTPASLESIAGIALTSYILNRVVTIINATSNDIEIKNDSGATTNARILTGVDDDITLTPDAALLLKYDPTSLRWRVIGGTGGASTVVKGTAGENLTALQFAALDLDGNIYKLDSSNDDRIESVGIVKADALSTESVKTITSGIIKGFTGLTVGAPLYADPLNAGGYTQTEPSDSSFNNKWVIRLGIAISETQVLLNPDQGSSAYFKIEISSKPELLNNQTTPIDVQDLIFDGTKIRGATVKYTIYRKTDTQEVAQIGDFKVIYKSVEGSWSLGADNFHGDDAGISFTITNSGQVQYTSTDLTGANYSGVLDYFSTEIFKI